MNREQLIAIVRDNWYLVAALVLCLGLGSHMLAQETRAEAAPAVYPTIAAAHPDPAVNSVRGPSPRSTERERAAATIARHRARVDENPAGTDAPVYWHAMGNLYRQKLGDYEQSAQCYERVLLDFPDWDGAHKVYTQLVTCYQRLGDREKVEWVLREMTRVFPEDNVEHQWAKGELGL